MHSKYESPLTQRYASKEMEYLFSEEYKIKTWRKLWVALAKSEQKLGLPISAQQIKELEEFCENINYDVAKEKEKEIRHDVMAHIYAYGQQAPTAKPIIHLGATSCYVGDNTEIIVIKEALEIIEKKLQIVITNLSKFAEEYAGVPTLGFTHYQPAQLTTVGKRATLWIQDLMLDLEELQIKKRQLKLLGCKGTTGTQASFKELFKSYDKCKELDQLICDEMGFESSFAVNGQTYPRKIDSQILNILSGIAQSATKFATDMRLLQNLKELEEPFEKKQVGSSAMAYKRNPMRSERMTSLARYVIVGSTNASITASSQWLERTLDDSANKRLIISESFLITDAILEIYANISQAIVVNGKIIEKHINEELPFMATEDILMSCVMKGGDRQELHEKIREHSMEASKQVKQHGKENDLLDRILNDKSMDISEEELQKTMNALNYTGYAKEQTLEYLSSIENVLLKEKKEINLRV